MKNPQAVLFLLVCSLVYLTAASAKEVAIATFHPSPNGNYRNLTTLQNTYLATTAGSKVGIGTMDPASTLSVNGGIQVGNDVAPCTVDKFGELRWNGAALQVCSAFAWSSL